MSVENVMPTQVVDEAPLGHVGTSNAKAPPRVLRVEVNGSLHDWFDIEEMGDFVRSPTFADTLLENIARYFHVPVENQAIYDEDGLLTTSADFSRALQRVAPMLYIYDVTEMGPELKERTVEELATINAGVEQTWRHFRIAPDVEKPQTNGHEAAESILATATLAGDDALLSAGPQPPLGVRPSDSTNTMPHVPSVPATFGVVDSEIIQTDSQTDVPKSEVYSLLVPTTWPDSTSKVDAPRLQSGEGTDVGATASLQTTGRTNFSVAHRNEDLIKAGSAKTSSVSPLGPQVRFSTKPVLASQATIPAQAQAQQQVKTSERARSASRSSIPPAPTRSTASVRWQSGLPASLTPSATAPSVAHRGFVVQAESREGRQLPRMMSGNTPGSLALDRPSSPTRSVTPPTVRRSLTPPPQNTKNYSLEVRSVTPTPKVNQALGVDGRLLNARPPPVSPAQVAPRNTGLLRMASGSQISFASVGGTEVSHSPSRSRAVTPPPSSARTLTPTAVAQHQRGADAHAQLLRQARSSTGSLHPSIQANSGSTPVRSLTYPSSMGGSQYSSQTCPLFTSQSANQTRRSISTLQHSYGTSLGASS